MDLCGVVRPGVGLRPVVFPIKRRFPDMTSRIHPLVTELSNTVHKVVFPHQCPKKTAPGFTGAAERKRQDQNFLLTWK